MVEPTHLKNISQNWIISPGRDENKQYLKTPPSNLLSTIDILVIYVERRGCMVAALWQKRAKPP